MDTTYLKDVFCLIIVLSATYFSFLDCANTNEECYLYQNLLTNLLTDLEPKSYSLTNTWCVQYCRKKPNKYRFAGTKDEYCYCLRNKPPSSYKRDFANCNTICPGSNSTYCGGVNISYAVTYVTISTLGCPPSVNIPFAQITAIVGRQKILTCEVGSPIDSVDHIKWIFTSVTGSTYNPVTTSPFASQNKYEGSTTNNPSLTINDVELTDQGEYRCWAKNMFGNSTSNMTQLSVIEMSDSSTSTLSEIQSTVLNNDRSTRIYTKSKTATADSSVTTVSHTQSSVTTAGMRPKRLLCSCQKRFVNTKWHFLDGKDISDAELRQLVLEDFDANIKPLIAVKKKNLSKAIRKRTSAENRRKSAQSVGSGLSVLLIVPVALIIAADLSRCFCSIRKNYHRNKTTKKCKKSGLSNTTIIIENEIFDHDAFYAVSGRAQQSKGLGNKPLDHHPRDMCDIHIKSVRSHARHVNNAYDKSEIEDKTELSFSTNRQNQSVNRKRVVFSSDEANPKCDSKTADYKQRVTLTKKQRKRHRKK